MKTMKRFGALFCAIALVFALAACNNSKGGTGEASVAEILAAADQKVAAAKSMEAKMTMDMDMVMNMDGQSNTIKTNTLMDMVMFNNPMKMKINMTMNMDMGELTAGTEAMQPMKMDMYILQQDSTYNMYTNDGTSWSVQPVDMSSIEQYNPQSSMELYLKSADSFQKVAEETINDVKATKYTGVIKGDAMEEVLNASGMLDNMNLGEGLEGLDLKALYSEMGDMPISIWIDEAGYPIRYEMDMKDFMNKIYEKLMQQMGDAAAGAQMSCTKVLVSMDCFNYDKAADFELPAEAMQ